MTKKIHAPSARTDSGTVCGYVGSTGTAVTCKSCLRTLDKVAKNTDRNT